MNNLVKDLNYKSLKFIYLSKKDKYTYFHLESISFKVIKEEMYIGELAIKSNILKISIKRPQNKNRKHKLININDPESINELCDWYLTEEIQICIFKIISEFSDKIYYSDALKCCI